MPAHRRAASRRPRIAPPAANLADVADVISENARNVEIAKLDERNEYHANIATAIRHAPRARVNDAPSELTPKAFGLWTADRSPDSRDDGHETETLHDKAVS